jgi:hypothetical protein
MRLPLAGFKAAFYAPHTRQFPFVHLLNVQNKRRRACKSEAKIMQREHPNCRPWQRRLEEIGGIKPLAFGQLGEMGPGL